MNIFVTDPDPIKSAQVLPDKHIVKCLRNLSNVIHCGSKKWGRGFGDLPKLDGTPYKTEKGAFRNHPCTSLGTRQLVVVDSSWSSIV
ncbi:MAG: hypothetical protein CM15mV4_1890 [Caudoviricetes sp.]|nr:MAG: hypothetical protein CM15mV4_1890 [Caudoviricetes sp.]